MYPITLYHDYHQERVRRVEQFAREREILRLARPERPGLQARLRAWLSANAPQQELRPQKQNIQARASLIHAGPSGR